MEAHTSFFTVPSNALHKGRAKVAVIMFSLFSNFMDEKEKEGKRDNPLSINTEVKYITIVHQVELLHIFYIQNIYKAASVMASPHLS